MTTLAIEYPEGFPWGTYDCTWWTLRRGRLVRDADGDNSVSHRYVAHLAKRVGRNEVIDCRCLSSPGGVTYFGSQQAKAAWDQEA